MITMRRVQFQKQMSQANFWRWVGKTLKRYSG
jgi:hypothetical protein